MSQSTQLLDLDPKLVFDLAARVDPPHVIAATYGLDPQYLSEVMETPHVKSLVAAKRKELEDGGFVLEQKAKLMFEDLLPDLYRKAKSENTTLSGVLEVAKFMRTVARLDRQDVGAAQAEKFSITIQFSGSSPSPSSQTVIDITPTDVTPTTPDAELPRLGSVPAFVLGQPHNLADLEYRDA